MSLFLGKVGYIPKYAKTFLLSHPSPYTQHTYTFLVIWKSGEICIKQRLANYNQIWPLWQE